MIEDKELGAQGAAIAAGIAAGVYADYEEGIRRTVKITKPCSHVRNTDRSMRKNIRHTAV